MGCLKVSVNLPLAIIQELISCEGVVVRDDSLINVIELVESPTGREVHKRFLVTNNSQDVDPLLHPGFGHPMYPYVPTQTQIEVFNLLSSYQPLTAQQIVEGGFPFIPAVFPVLGGFQYHHDKIAIQAIQEEIQTAETFAPQCPGILALLPGQTICDLTITYANVIIVTRIHKL